MHVVGLDIGGANIKAANADGQTAARSFEIWNAPDRLPEILKDVLAEFSNVDLLAVTMTAELADCFETKAEGVDFILHAVEEAAGEAPVFVWQTGAEFVTPDIARDIPMLVAAANWHALATWVARMTPEANSLLIDIGTTTTDLIPLAAGAANPEGMTDCRRLISGELVYTGVRRTPVCAIADAAPYRGDQCPLSAELFATTLDVYLTLGQIAENPSDLETADGRGATKHAARDRLARMLCCDRTEFTAEDAYSLARFLADCQKRKICDALARVLARHDGDFVAVIFAGSGAFLAEEIVSRHPQLKNASTVTLADLLDAPTAQAACALAVARLSAERIVG